MHIGIDVGLRKANSQLYDQLLVEEKDYEINSTIEQLIMAVLNKEENTVYNMLSYADLRKYYTVLEPYVHTAQLHLNQPVGEPYVTGLFPIGIDTSVVTDASTPILLYKGITYKFKAVDAGADLASWGTPAVASIAVGDTFVCDISDITAASIVYTKEEQYRLLNPTDGTFTTMGAPDNDPGTLFTCTAAGTATGWANNPTVEVMADTLSAMRYVGCVLDVFSGISRWSIAARTPFVCVDTSLLS